MHYTQNEKTLFSLSLDSTETMENDSASLLTLVKTLVLDEGTVAFEQCICCCTTVIEYIHTRSLSRALRECCCVLLNELPLEIGLFHQSSDDFVNFRLF